MFRINEEEKEEAAKERALKLRESRVISLLDKYRDSKIEFQGLTFRGGIREFADFYKVPYSRALAGQELMLNKVPGWNLERIALNARFNSHSKPSNKS